MKRKVATVVLFSCLVSLAAYATPRRLVVVGVGRASEADQSAAESEAFNAAQVNANGQCILGAIEDNNYLKISDSCVPADDGSGNTTWMCAVNVRAICLIGR
jgi:hypothetical protein